MIGDIVNVSAAGLQHALHSAHGGDDLTVAL
jgi:hypothetical protein